MTARRIQYTGDGVETDFPFAFRVFETDEVAVWLDQAAVAPADFTVALADPGGTVSFAAAPANGAVVTLVGVVVPKRIATYQQAGAFRAAVINAELDRAVAVLEQLAEGQSRRLALPEIDPVSFAALPSVAERAERYLSFDAAGQPIARDIVGGVPISLWAIPFVDSVDAAAARGLLELAAGAQAVATLGLGGAAVEDVAAGGTGELLRADGDGSGLSGIVAGGGYPPGHIFGLEVANNAADPANDLDIAAGGAWPESGAGDLDLAAGLTKRLDAAWALGTDAGGLDTGAAAADTWYAVHLIGGDAVATDVLLSESATAPSLPAGYDRFRRIGWRLTDGAGALRAARQDGERLTWLDYADDAEGASFVASETLFTLSAPPSLPANVMVMVDRTDNTYHTYAIYTPGDPAPTDWILVGSLAYLRVAAFMSVTLDASSRIAVKAINANTSRGFIKTLGWIDTRGRD